MGKSKQLHVKVKVKVKSVDSLLDIKDALVLFGGGINISDLILPGLKVEVLSLLKRLLEGVTNLLEFLALVEILPVGT